MYSIIPAFAACLRDSSESAEHGTIIILGNSVFNLSIFSFAVGLSILFAAIIIGFVECLSVLVKFARSSSVQDVGFSGSSFNFIKTDFTSSSFTLNPENCFDTSFEKSCFVVWIVLDSFSHAFSKMPRYHLLSSFSNIFTSWTGSPEPSLPSMSVVPDASTT